MEASHRREKFFLILCTFVGLPPLDSPTSPPRDGHEFSGTPAAASMETPVFGATFSNNNNNTSRSTRSRRRRRSGSSWRSSTELLAPAMFCTGIFSGIPPQVQDRKHYHEFLLYEPLLALVFLGISVSVVAMFYALWRSQPTVVEVEEVEDEERLKRAVQVKEILLEVGLICSLLAFLLRVMLQLRLDSLGRVAAIFFTGGVAAALYLKMAASHPREMVSFSNILCKLSGLSKNPTPYAPPPPPHPPLPLDDLGSSSKPTAASAEAQDSGAASGKKSSNGSSRRSLMELLAPAMFCTGIFSSIPPQVQDRKHYHEFLLYEPLIALVLLGTSASAVAMFYGLRRSQPAAVEVEEAEDEERAQRAEQVKERLLNVGLIIALFTFLLRVMLQLRLDTLGHVAALFFAGGVATILYFYILYRYNSLTSCNCESQKKMATSYHGGKSSFKNILRTLFGLSGNPTPSSPHPPPPLDDPKSSSTTIAASTEVQDSGATSRNKNNSRSSRRSLTELLAPATLCTNIFFSIPPQVQDRKHYHEFLLYQPLLALVLVGISASVVVMLYALHRSQPTAVQAEKAEDEERLQMVEQVKERLLVVGLIYSLFAFLLRVMLQLSMASLGREAAMFFTGGVATALYFYIVYLYKSLTSCSGESQEKMAASCCREMSFKNILRKLFGQSAVCSHTTPQQHSPSPLDLESSDAPATASTEVRESGTADSNKNNSSTSSGSSLRSLTELLGPAMFCTGIFSSIPSTVQDRKQYHEFILYEPLLVLVLLSISTSVVAMFYALRISQSVDKERLQRVEQVTNKLLGVGLIYSLLACLPRVMLQLSLASLGRVAALFFGGSVAAALHFYMGYLYKSLSSRDCESQEKMAASSSREKSFKNILRTLIGQSAPLDLGSSGAPAAASTEDPELGTADSNKNNSNASSGSSRRSWTELLAPAMFCTGILSSIPAQVQDRKYYHEFPFYEPLLALVLLGILASVVAMFYTLRRSQPTAVEAAKFEDEERLQREDQVEKKLLGVGLIYSLLAFLLRVMLELSLPSLGRVAAMFFTGGVAGSLRFYIGLADCESLTK